MLAPIPMGQPGASYTTTVRLAGGAAGFHDPVATARGRQLNAVVFFYWQHDYDHELRYGTGGSFDAARRCARAGRGVQVAPGMLGEHDARMARVVAREIGQLYTGLGSSIPLHGGRGADTLWTCEGSLNFISGFHPVLRKKLAFLAGRRR